MTLVAGTRLGPYEILAPLGADGLKGVYRARETPWGFGGPQGPPLRLLGHTPSLSARSTLQRKRPVSGPDILGSPRKGGARRNRWFL